MPLTMLGPANVMPLPAAQCKDNDLVTSCRDSNEYDNVEIIYKGFCYPATVVTGCQ